MKRPARTPCRNAPRFRGCLVPGPKGRQPSSSPWASLSETRTITCTRIQARFAQRCNHIRRRVEKADAWFAKRSHQKPRLVRQSSAPSQHETEDTKQSQTNRKNLLPKTLFQYRCSLLARAGARVPLLARVHGCTGATAGSSSSVSIRDMTRAHRAAGSSSSVSIRDMTRAHRAGATAGLSSSVSMLDVTHAHRTYN
jgi:hypothetical protein